jgi:hypothetical protein
MEEPANVSAVVTARQAAENIFITPRSGKS